MKRIGPLVLLSALVPLTTFLACSDDTSPFVADDDAGPRLDATAADGASGDAASDASSDADGRAPVDLTPRMLASGPATISGVTSDGHVVYRGGDGLYAVALTPGATPKKITDASATVIIRGRVVFVFTNVDYGTNFADLSVWSATYGSHAVGQVLFADDLVAASDDGQLVAFVNHVTTTTNDVVVATADLSRSEKLVAAGRSSETTCRARFGFVANGAVVAWCSPGSATATLQRFTALTAFKPDAGGTDAAADADASTWSARTLATDALSSSWSADPASNRLFYVTTGSAGKVIDNDTIIPIDNGVSWGAFLPSGNALLYTVGDQLRRTPLNPVSPMPLVTVGYSQRTAFSPALDYALYSKTVTYEGLEKRDLFLAPTSQLSSNLDTLVEGANGNISRSAFTADGKFVLWLTNLTQDGATLNVRAVGGGSARTFANVDSVLAASASKILFTDHRSPSSSYPITDDLEVVDLANAQAAPTLLRARITDGRAFQLTPAGDAVIYAAPPPPADAGPDASADAGLSEGLFIQGIP